MKEGENNMPKKLERCVKKVSVKSGKKAAYAICTSSLQKSGAVKKSKKNK